MDGTGENALDEMRAIMKQKSDYCQCEEKCPCCGKKKAPAQGAPYPVPYYPMIPQPINPSPWPNYPFGDNPYRIWCQS